ncbi:MAG: MazG-like family protein [Bacillota bacterium]|nr:MazG-like family protein [Bacillota bacterium]
MGVVEGAGAKERETISRADIARNLKTIEWLKTELVASISSLFKAMLKTNDEACADALANLVIGCYLLGKRLGLPHPALDAKIKEKIKANIEQNHEIETWYGDFSALKRHLSERKM